MIAMCPRPESHLTYMIPIALTTEFVLTAVPGDGAGRVIGWSTAGAVVSVVAAAAVAS
jgi:hypothetical protein